MSDGMWCRLNVNTDWKISAAQSSSSTSAVAAAAAPSQASARHL